MDSSVLICRNPYPLEREVVQMSKDERWMSLAEIAEHLVVSTDTVHRWLRNRNMPAHRVGRLWRFLRSEVDEWVKSGKAKQT